MDKPKNKKHKKKKPLTRRLLFISAMICIILYWYCNIKELGLVTALLMTLDGVPSAKEERKRLRKLKKKGVPEDIGRQELAVVRAVSYALFGIGWLGFEIISLFITVFSN